MLCGVVERAHGPARQDYYLEDFKALWNSIGEGHAS